jgi:hypothetical protein
MIHIVSASFNHSTQDRALGTPPGAANGIRNFQGKPWGCNYAISTKSSIFFGLIS